MNMPFRVIGSYCFDRRRILSKSKYVTVYEGGQHHTREFTFAFKEINMRQDRLVEEFAWREVEVLKELQSHQNIVNYIDHFVDADKLYIITEMCRKENLYQRVKQFQQLSEVECLQWIEQLVNGYEHIRQKGYIHRDLKPENILIDHQNRLKIADFGYSMKLQGQFFEGRHNIGTPLYMAPETLRHNLYSQKADVWSLGIIIYEMIHGDTPFKVRTQEELLQKMKQPISLMKCSTTTALLINSCLRYDPTLRPAIAVLREEVKLAMVEKKKEKEAVRKAEARSQALNELDYVQFLEYLLRLVERAVDHTEKKCIDEQTRGKLDFIVKHTIRVRLSLVKTLIGRYEIQLDHFHTKRFNGFCQTYKEKPVGHRVDNTRLRLFKSGGEVYHQQEHWQSQAVLKQVLSTLWGQLKDLRSEEELARREDEVRLLDYLLSAFALNALLIENQNSMKEFTRCSHLQEILSNPTRFSYGIYLDISRKVRDLKITEQNHDEK